MISIRRSVELGLIFYIGMVLWGGFHTTYPDGALRLELTHSLLTAGSVITAHGPVNYAPLQSILMLPVYALGYGYGMMVDASPEKVFALGSVAAYFLFLPVVISLLCVLYFRLLQERGVDETLCLISTAILFGATFLMSYARGLFSEPLSALLMLYSFYFFQRAQSADYLQNNRRNLACVSLLILNNFVFVLYAGWMVACVIWTSRVRRNNPAEAGRMALEGSLWIGLSVMAFLFYNYLRYGQFLNFGYAGEGFNGNMLMGLYGLLFSFGKGLLVFSPVTVLCMLYFLFHSRELESWWRFHYSAILLAFAGYLIVYAKWDAWFGGLCWGPRFLLPFLPLLHLIFPELWRSLAASGKLLKSGMALLIAWAVGMNFLNYLDPEAVFREGNLQAGETYIQKLFVPELSVQFKIWQTANVWPNLLVFLAILAGVIGLLGFWHKGISAKTFSRPQPIPSQKP